MKLEELFAKIKQLPVMPQLLQTLMVGFNDDNVNLKSVSKKVAMDQAIGARVLKMANSAAFSRGTTIKSVEDAAIRLGFKSLRSLVVAASLSNAFPKHSTFDHVEFWVNTFRIANIAKTLAALTEVDSDSAFTCAMLHNIGEILIQSALPEDAALIEMVVEQGESRISAQRQTLGFDYSIVGAELAKRWQFSELFLSAIGQQLDPLGHKPVSDEAVLIRLAIFASFAITKGIAPAMVVKSFPAPLVRHLNLDLDKASEALAEMPDQDEEIAALFGG